ncbi:MAG: hypothetical protein SV062_07860 [Thermodesulfobacteriota bacterium]|nr:hypothetical protein [Thermodesulfobacteriota bacterium]
MTGNKSGNKIGIKFFTTDGNLYKTLYIETNSEGELQTLAGNEFKIGEMISIEDFYRIEGEIKGCISDGKKRNFNIVQPKTGEPLTVEIYK